MNIPVNNMNRRKIDKIIGSVAIVLLVLSQMIATFVEKYADTATANAYIYYTLWFGLLWGCVAYFIFRVVAKKKNAKRQLFLLIHFSFIIIIAGFALTRFLSDTGIVVAQRGMKVGTYISQNNETGNQAMQKLPFSVVLNRYETENYPGSVIPSSYTSWVSVLGSNDTLVEEFKVEMNKPLQYNGYKLYQSSFDEDNDQVILLLNHDPYGTALTYSGFILLIISLLATFFFKNSRIRLLLRHPSLIK